MMRFYDRKDEIASLEQLWKSSKKRSQFATVSGMRRVGKTCLLTEFAKGKRAVYLFIQKAMPSNVAQYIADSARKSGVPILGSPSLSEAFSAIFDYAKQEQTLLIIDEIQNFSPSAKDAFSIIQSQWDRIENTGGIMLVASGSYDSALNDIFEGRSMPLYGRPTAKLRIRPFGFGIVQEMLSDMGQKGLFAQAEAYMLFGGLPRYYALMDASGAKTWQGALEKMLFGQNTVLESEIRSIFYDEFKSGAPRQLSIISAIASGKTSLNNISNATGIPITQLPRYLELLSRKYGFVEKELPLGANKKEGTWKVKDSFASFYFRFIYPRNREQLALEAGAVGKNIAENSQAFFGKRFEKLCAELLPSSGLVPFEPVRVSYWRNRQGEDIDIVVEGKREFLLVSCKWRNKGIANADAHELVALGKKACLKGKLHHLIICKGAQKGRELCGVRVAGFAELVSHMNSTEGTPLQAAGYHCHSVEILPVRPRRKRRGISQLAINGKAR